MLHDNAATQDLIATFGWEQFDHAPYSPDLAPSDFHVFLHLKNFLGGWRFHDDKEIKEAVNT
jgi:histone-lysine N-methyltransferase SETMAR